MAIEIADELFDIADQLRGSGMSMSNNISEGSGSGSNRVFHRYLDIARSSTFENANITILLSRRKIMEKDQETKLLEELDHLCRKITSFQKTLK